MIISLGALAGITSVLLVLLMGQPRIFFSMSRDGLLPEAFSRVHPKYKTPVATTLMTGGIVAIAAGLTPIDVSSELVSIGTLFAFIIVCAGVILLRYKHPEYRRPFKVPMFPYLPGLGALLCACLMISLPRTAWGRFIIWLVLGLTIFFLYGRHHSRLEKEAQSGQL